MSDNLSRLQQLSEKELLIYNAEIGKARKSTGVAYLLYFFFGGLGAHKFYLGQPMWGFLYLCGAICCGIGLALPPVLVLCIPWSIGLLIDLFTIPAQNRGQQEKAGDQIISRLIGQRA